MTNILDQDSSERDAGGKPGATFPHPALDHDDFGSTRSEVMNVIDSKSLERKGWCPGALRPMQAKDGLLVRLRITGATLAAGTLRRIATAGRAHGNGLFDLTSRANLQMRGVAAPNLPLLLDELDGLGLVDETASAEAVRNVLVSPLAGLDAVIDVRGMAAALEAALVCDTNLHRLPGKFGFLIDESSQLSLATVPADIRFSSLGRSGHFEIALGGTARDAIALGACTQDEIVPVALRLAHAFLRLDATMPEPPRRMRDLLRSVAPAIIAAAAGLPFAPPAYPHRAETDAEPCPIGLLEVGKGSFCFGAGAAFGRLDAAMLDAATEAAETFGSGEIRLTPWRALLFTGVESLRGADLRQFLAARGFITDPGDERLAIAACGGLLSCEHGTTETHADALALSGLARTLQKSGIALHVSGCAKGCARQVPTPYTLIGNKGRYDLVVIDSKGVERDAGGKPGATFPHPALADACAATGLTLADARKFLQDRAERKVLRP